MPLSLLSESKLVSLSGVSGLQEDRKLRSDSKEYRQAVRIIIYPGFRGNMVPVGETRATWSWWRQLIPYIYRPDENLIRTQKTTPIPYLSLNISIYRS